MKKIWIFATLAALSCAGNLAQAQGHKIGLIDMAHVFKNYKKFEALREDLKAEIKQSDQKAQALAGRIKNVQSEMKTFKEGSPEFNRKEAELAKLAVEFESYRKIAQRGFLRKEADIYKTIYLEVADTVKLYAQFKKYTLVVRFNREPVGSNPNPPAVLASMNKQIVYHQESDDITDHVLKYLNDRYAPPVGGGGIPRKN